MEIESIPPETSVGSSRRESDEQRYALWDALADFGIDAMDGAAVQFCMRQVASSITAQQAFWAGTVRVGHDDVAAKDPYRGWRLGAWAAMGHTQADSPEWMRTAARTFNASGTRDLTASRRVLEQTGRFRVFALSKGMVDLDAYRQSQAYDYYFRQQGIVDRIWVMFPVNDDSESCFCFDRFEGHSAFDDRDIEWAGEALRGIKWFHRQLLLSHGLGVAKESLTPAECGIVRELLTGSSEKVIAGRLNLTPASAHQYVVHVYRKFGVHGRAEFMSLWLNKRS
jgi:DNA-binding CsgD family transcriptional regulator